MVQTHQTQARHPTCLIIEDSEFYQLKMKRVVERSPYRFRVQVANTLKDARRALFGERPRLILLDNNLPDGLGTDFAVEMARDSALAAVPMIIVSDWPSPFMWEKAASAGVAYVISKSEFDPRFIHAALRGKSGLPNPAGKRA